MSQKHALSAAQHGELNYGGGRGGNEKVMR